MRIICCIALILSAIPIISCGTTSIESSASSSIASSINAVSSTAAQKTAIPTVSLPGGNYTNITNTILTISCSTPLSTIGWSTNGGALWTTGNSLMLDHNIILFAYAARANYIDSDVLTNTYVILRVNQTNFQIISCVTNLIETNGFGVSYWSVTNNPLSFFSNFVLTNSGYFAYSIITISNASTNGIEIYKISNTNYYTNYFASITNHWVILVEYSLFSTTTNSLSTNGLTISYFTTSNSPTTWFSNFQIISSATVPNQIVIVSNVITNSNVIMQQTNTAYFTNYLSAATNSMDNIVVSFMQLVCTTNYIASNGFTISYNSISNNPATWITNIIVTNSGTITYLVTNISNALTNTIGIYNKTNIYAFTITNPANSNLNYIPVIRSNYSLTNTISTNLFITYPVSVYGAIRSNLILSNFQISNILYQITNAFTDSIFLYSITNEISIIGGYSETNMLYSEIGLNASDNADQSWFGYSVSINGNGDNVLVGAQVKNVGYGVGYGKAYLYRWNGINWGETSFVPLSPAPELFGSSVSLNSNGNVLAIGAWSYDKGAIANQGRVYSYIWNGYSWDQSNVTAPDAAAGDRFGYSVCLTPDGNSLIVGAPGKTIAGIHGYMGGAYVYTYNGVRWSTGTIITPSDYTSDDGFGNWFGNSVSVNSDGSVFVVGAFHKYVNSKINQGKIYVYKNYVESSITASDGNQGDMFGSSVSISGDGNRIVASSPSVNKVYIYDWTGSYWAETILSDPNLGGSALCFGNSVSISPEGNAIVVGATNSRAYVYKLSNTNWQATKVISFDSVPGDNFGYCVSAGSNAINIAVGAYLKNGAAQGKAYIYRYK